MNNLYGFRLGNGAWQAGLVAPGLDLFPDPNDPDHGSRLNVSLLTFPTFAYPALRRAFSSGNVAGVSSTIFSRRNCTAKPEMSARNPNTNAP